MFAGAGLAQLYTAELLENDELKSQLPADIKIRALCYGAPPVFRSREGEEEKVYPEIIILQNDKDGIIASVFEITWNYIEIKYCIAELLSKLSTTFLTRLSLSTQLISVLIS